MKIRVIQQGDREFAYDGEDEASLRQALLHETGGVPSIVYDITDLDRSDMDADEYLIVTEDDGTPVWSGWLGGVQRPAPAVTIGYPAPYAGPTAHTYTPGCAGHHPIAEPCPQPGGQSARWRKKQDVTDAVQFDGSNRRQVLQFAYPRMSEDGLHGAEVMALPVVVSWAGGDVTHRPGDWVIREHGAIGVMDATAFAAVYEPAIAGTAGDGQQADLLPQLRDLAAGWTERPDQTATHDEIAECLQAAQCARELLATIGEAASEPVYAEQLRQSLVDGRQAPVSREFAAELVAASEGMGTALTEARARVAELEARLADGGAEHPSCDAHRWWAVVRHHGSFAYGFAAGADGLRVWDDVNEFERAKAQDFE